MEKGLDYRLDDIQIPKSDDDLLGIIPTQKGNKHHDYLPVTDENKYHAKIHYEICGNTRRYGLLKKIYYSKGVTCVYTCHKTKRQTGGQLSYRPEEKIIKMMHTQKLEVADWDKYAKLKVLELGLIFLLQGKRLTRHQMEKRACIRKPDLFYMILPHCGEALYDRLLRAPTSLSAPEKQLNIMLQLVLSLARIHQEGYVHLDIKTENAMLKGDKAFLIDPFPLKWQLVESKKDKINKELGFYGSMHSRCLQNIDYKARDIRALGFTLYELLAWSNKKKAMYAEAVKYVYQLPKICGHIRKITQGKNDTTSQKLQNFIIKMIQEPTKVDLMEMIGSLRKREKTA